MIILLIFLIFLGFPQILETDQLNNDELQQSISNNLKYESDDPNLFIVYRAFVVKYINDLKIPKFTIHKLTVNQITPINTKAKRRGNFFIDDHRLKYNSASNRDYKKSGYDRGHMVPAGDFYWNQLLKNETFVMTNICPQNPILNRGIWANLENTIRKKILTYNSDGYVVTGSIVLKENKKLIGVNKIPVPHYIYKLVFYEKKLEMYAFFFDNYLSTYSNNLNDFQVSIDEIEKIVGEDFFDLLDDTLEDSLESLVVPMYN